MEFKGKKEGGRRRSGVMLKINIPPLMGRRDAAYDVAENMVVNSFSEAAVARALELLTASAEDTRNVLPMFGSPDTIDREQHLLAYLNKLINLLQTVLGFCKAARDFSYAAKAADRERELVDPASAEELVNDSHFIFTQQELREKSSEFFRLARPRLKRYREYAAKNSSFSNAGRYRRSYEAYVKFYGGAGTPEPQVQDTEKGSEKL